MARRASARALAPSHGAWDPDHPDPWPSADRRRCRLTASAAPPSGCQVPRLACGAPVARRLSSRRRRRSLNALECAPGVPPRRVPHLAAFGHLPNSSAKTPARLIASPVPRAGPDGPAPMSTATGPRRETVVRHHRRRQRRPGRQRSSATTSPASRHAALPAIQSHKRGAESREAVTLASSQAKLSLLVKAAERELSNA